MATGGAAVESFVRVEENRDQEKPIDREKVSCILFYFAFIKLLGLKFTWIIRFFQCWQVLV